MSDLISRCELFNRLAPVQTLGEAYGIIQEMPTVDAVSVRHGRWMEIPEAEMFMCSECGEPGLSFDDVYVYDLKPANFCPNCGADMRKDGDHGKT